MGANFRLPLNSTANAQIAESFVGWTRVAAAGQIWAWHYVVNFPNYVSPFPNYGVMGADLRFFRSLGVGGVYEEGDGYSGGSDMAELKTWLLGKLLWCPEQDDTALTKAFIRAYYGPAVAPFISHYMQLFVEAAANTSTVLDPEANCIPGPAVCVGKMDYLAPETMLRSLSIFQQAASALGTANRELSMRLRVAELPTLYVILVRWSSMRAWAAARRYPWPLSENISAVYDGFAQTYTEHGMDVGVWCPEKGDCTSCNPCRDNALGEWSGAGLKWFKKQIGAHSMSVKTDDTVTSALTGEPTHLSNTAAGASAAQLDSYARLLKSDDRAALRRTEAEINALCARSPLLFVDFDCFTDCSPALKLRMNPPNVGQRVITPTKPWERFAIVNYPSVLRMTPDLVHLYYGCASGVSEHEPYRICLATSTDGFHFFKPDLGIYSFENSTANNIIREGYLGSVFLDTNPAAKAEERYKMVALSTALDPVHTSFYDTVLPYVYGSPDGVNFTQLYSKPSIAHVDDTATVTSWNQRLQRYVSYVRVDHTDQNCFIPPWFTKKHKPCTPKLNLTTDPFMRRIGRCESSDLLAVDTDSPDGCPIVFGPDSLDPNGTDGKRMDIYTNSHTEYEGVHLFFPSIFNHFSPHHTKAPPYNFKDDGILDVRLVVSRDGLHLHYPPSDNARRPYISLGLSQCPTAPGHVGGWCGLGNREMEDTSFATSGIYMASGYVLSSDGTSVLQYAVGQPYTHGWDAPLKKNWGNNTGVFILTSRRDSFVSIDAPYAGFGLPPHSLPSFTTVPLALPQCNGTGVSILLNIETSVVGFALIATTLVGDGTGLMLEESDPIVGNAIRALATWNNGTVDAIHPDNANETVVLQVALVDTRLFAIELVCAGNMKATVLKSDDGAVPLAPSPFLPPLLRLNSGSMVTSSAGWPNRREEVWALTCRSICEGSRDPLKDHEG
jgi:hypothetical protein